MRYFLISVLLFFSISLFANDELIVEQTSANTAWTISSIRELTFDGNGVNITFNDESSVYYSKETLTMIKFNVNTSGITDLNNTPRFSITENILTIPDNSDEIKIYSLSGSLVMQGKGSQLNISNLSSGAYLVQTDSITIKIVKQ